MVEKKKTKNRPQQILFNLVFAACILSVVPAFADPDHGRLADGRAYRTDTGGNQLVDYIAELELNNSTLRQQVSGLENEVAQKQALIDSSKSGGCAISDKIKETDLLKSPSKIGQKTEIKSALNSQGGAASGSSCPSCVACSACDCTAQISQAKQESQEAVRRAQAEISLQTQQREQELQRTKTDLKTMQIQVAQLQRTNNQTAPGSEADLKAAQRETAELREQFSSDLESLKGENQQLKEERDTLRSAQSAFQSKIASLQEAASRQPEQAEPVQEVKASFNTNRMSGARDAAFEALRGKILTSLNQIQGLVATRDRLYAEYMRSGHQVNFSPAPARASSGNTLQQIRAASDDAVTVRELSLLIRDVNEIRSKVDFDIGMMERMKRLRQ